MNLSGRKKRREVNLYSYYDHAGIVRHLEELARQGITPGTIRLSIGTEHIDDILADLAQALEAV